jgi:hypothetical protein
VGRKHSNAGGTDKGIVRRGGGGQQIAPEREQIAERAQQNYRKNKKPVIETVLFGAAYRKTL